MNDDAEWTPEMIDESKGSEGTPVSPVSPEPNWADTPRSSEQAIFDSETAETAPEIPVSPDNLEGPESSKDLLSGLLSRWERTWTPPDIVRNDLPSLRKVIEYAWVGDWGPRTGVWRTLGKIDAIVFAIPVVTLLYSLAWAWERPSRRYALISLISALAWWLNWWFWI